MPTSCLAEELAACAGSEPRNRPSIEESRGYCRRLAKRHYENFVVASWLLPKKLRTHFYPVYAYCRGADDLADEIGDSHQSLALLARWEEELRAAYDGQPRHPVFVALAETIREFDIPPEPFLDLLDAFRQDQRVTRYETFDDLLDYCRRSANPVGRILLYLDRCHSGENAELSDKVCTGLQLANFWQDVAGDWDRGRIYVPWETCRRFGYDEAEFTRRDRGPAFRRMLSYEVDRAEGWLREGLPLVDRVSSQLRGDVWLFIQGGLAILHRIRRADFDVWSRRPKVSKLEQLRLLVGCLWRDGRWRSSRSCSDRREP